MVAMAVVIVTFLLLFPFWIAGGRVGGCQGEGHGHPISYLLFIMVKFTKVIVLTMLELKFSGIWSIHNMV